MNREQNDRPANKPIQPQAPLTTFWEWFPETDHFCPDSTWLKMVGLNAGPHISSFSQKQELIHRSDRKEIFHQVSRILSGEIREFTAEFRMREDELHFYGVSEYVFSIGVRENGKPARIIGLS